LRCPVDPYTFIVGVDSVFDKEGSKNFLVGVV
jgi:hypothetical protein